MYSDMIFNKNCFNSLTNVLRKWMDGILKNINTVCFNKFLVEFLITVYLLFLTNVCKS